MAEPPPSKGDQRFQVLLILALWIFLGYLYLVVGLEFSPGQGLVDTPGGDSEPQASAQGQTQIALAFDRAKLHEGTASAHYDKTVKVGKPFTIQLAICGSAVKQCQFDAPSAPQAGNRAAVTKAVRAGGYIYAELKSLNRDLQVGPDDNGEQLVQRPADVGRWEWSLTATRPGEYQLTVNATTRWGKDTKSLEPTVKLPRITVTAQDTAATWTARWANRLGDFLGSVGGALAAQFAAVVGFLVYRHSRRNTPAPAAAPAPATPPPPVPPVPTTVPRRPRRRR